jgi:chromosome segregation ATPase
MEIHQLHKRLSYLERNLSMPAAAPEAAPAAAPAAAPVATISPELESALKAQVQELKEKVEAMEQTITSLLDRVINLKEKLQPTVDITALEMRITSLEEVTTAIVGMGRSA